MVSDTLGLVDFAVRPLNSVLNLPDGQSIFLGGNSITEELQSILLDNFLFLGGGGGGLIEMTFGLVHARYSLPEWEALN